MLIKNGFGSFLQFGQYIYYDILDMLAVCVTMQVFFFFIFFYLGLSFSNLILLKC